MRQAIFILIAVAILSILCAEAFGIERFPPPEFDETGHQLPTTTTPDGRVGVYEYVDAMVLFAALGLSAYLVLKQRSRRSIFLLMVFSLVYFGFWRKGCICPIGAIGNVALSIFDSNYAMPFSALLFFILPLVFTLFFGRVFCAAVCPLGAVQDLVTIKPMSLPSWLERVLRLLAYGYLAFAILFAATGSAFVICRYDPFVGFFRLNGNFNILVIGICFLLIGMFVGRPYCRFVCPYGVILRWLSRLSRRRVTITPDECIKCGLCGRSCPFGAIDMPMAAWPSGDYVKSKKRLGILMLLLPVMVVVGGWVIGSMSESASRMNATVRLAERMYLEETGAATDTTDASVAFRKTGRRTGELYDEAAAIKSNFSVGCWFVGGFLGLVVALKLLRNSIRWKRDDYEANRASCVACGRCYRYCPREHVRLKLIGTGRDL